MARRKRKNPEEKHEAEADPSRDEVLEFDPDRPIEQYIGQLDPRVPHPNDIDQHADHDIATKDLGEKGEGENFDKFDVEEAIRGRGGAACNSVLVMKYNKRLPMWFDEFLCPRVMPGKWCGYVAYAFRRRIRFGSWHTWHDVPADVKDEAWKDIMDSWDIRTELSEEDLKSLRKQWTTYASNRFRNWKTKLADRYIFKPPKKPLGPPWLKYRWMDEKEWEVFECYRRSLKFKKLRDAGIANANKNKKKFRHRTGSAGYRIIYIRLAREMREQAILERMSGGMTREEAEDDVSGLYFRVDRSIVFLEGNKSKVTGKYCDDYVADLEDPIMRMNKEKKEGKLKLEGKRDILAIATGKEDHSGRYRGCRGTAKQSEALPHYRRPMSKKMKAMACGSDSGKLDVARLDDFAGWICRQLGVEKPPDINPTEFLESNGISPAPSSSTQPKCHMKTAPGQPDGGDFDKKGGVPCLLQVRSPDGGIVTASAGMVLPERLESLQVIPNAACVVIRPPIFLPNAAVHYYSVEYPTVGRAVGVPINWPEEFIDYKMKKPAEEDLEDNLDNKMEDKLEDDDSTTGSDSDESTETEGSDTEEIKEEYAPVHDSLCTPVLNVYEEFAHHARDPDARSALLKNLNLLKNSPGARDMYRLAVDPALFSGKHTHKIVLDVAGTIQWINQARAPARKKWIHNNQIDVWSSFLFSKMTEEDKSRVHFFNTNATNMDYEKKSPQARQNFLDAVHHVFESVHAELYVMPICVKFHWTMLFIVPEISTFFCIDSNKQIIHPVTRQHEYSLLMSIAARYDEQIRKEVRVWTVKNIIHKKQAGGWECGYFCMLYMEKIALLTNHVDVMKAFPEDHDAYPSPVVEGLIDTYCRHVNEVIIPKCREACDKPKRKAKQNSAPTE